MSIDKTKEDTNIEKQDAIKQIDRIAFFSDAVMAIVITLLVIDISLPETGVVDIYAEFISLVPTFMSFCISFFIIASYWIVHHKIFKYIKKFDTPFLWINFLFLFFICFTPFPTSLLGKYIEIPFVIVFYSLMMIGLGLATCLLWYYASKNFRLIDEKTPSEVIYNISLRNTIGPIGFSIAIPFAFVNFYIPVFIWCAVPIAGRIIVFLLNKLKIKKRIYEKN